MGIQKHDARRACYACGRLTENLIEFLKKSDPTTPGFQFGIPLPAYAPNVPEKIRLCAGCIEDAHALLSKKCCD